RSLCLPPARRQRCTSTARTWRGFSAPRNTSLNWTIPELVNSRVGSLAGTSDAEGTTAWPRAAKNSRKSLRIPEVVFIRKRLSDLVGIETYRCPDAVPVEAPAQQEIGGLAPDRKQFEFGSEASAGELAGPALPVVLAGFGQGGEGGGDDCLIHAVAGQLGTDPQRPLPAHGTRARQAAGKAHIVLPARLGHLRHRGVRLLGGDAPGQQLAGQLGTGVLAPHQQRERLLRRRGLAPWPPHPRLLRVGVVAFRLGFGRHELLAQGGLQRGGDFRVVLQELAGVLLALADALVAVAVPGAGLLDQARVHAHVDQLALAGN